MNGLLLVVHTTVKLYRYDHSPLSEIPVIFYAILHVHFLQYSVQHLLFSVSLAFFTYS